ISFSLPMQGSKRSSFASLLRNTLQSDGSPDFLHPGSIFFMWRLIQRLADKGNPHVAVMQKLRRKAFLFAQQAKEKVLRANVLMGKSLSLLCSIGQHTLALIAQRQVH